MTISNRTIRFIIITLIQCYKPQTIIDHPPNHHWKPRLPSERPVSTRATRALPAVSNQTWNARHNTRKLSARPRSTCEAKNQLFESPDYHLPPPTPRITCNTPLGRNSKDERRRTRVTSRHTKKRPKRAKENRPHPDRSHTRRTIEDKERTKSRSRQCQRLGKQPRKVTQTPHHAPPFGGLINL